MQEGCIPPAFLFYHLLIYYNINAIGGIGLAKIEWLMVSGEIDYKIL